MSVINRTAAICKSANAEEDIQLINRFTMREMMPDEVYCFQFCICDNENDRANERFSVEALKGLVPLLEGKPILKDHDWSAEEQTARIYKTWIEQTQEKTSYGMPLVRLMGAAYLPITDDTKSTIDKIDAGIWKEVSVGCRCEEKNCSICGSPMSLDWRTWSFVCDEDHVKGSMYDGTLCVCVLEKPIDGFETSFCAVPCQPGAGVTKGEERQRVTDAFDTLLSADLTEYDDNIEKLLPRLKGALMDAEEKAKRQAFLRYAEGL